jgi:hypothetical protein
MENDLGRVLDELTVMRAESRETLVKVTRIEEQVKDVGDHEARVRVLEAAVPPDLKGRVTSLEHWRYGLPITAVVSLGGMILSAWTAAKGG